MRTVRLAQPDDLDTLLELAGCASFGLTTLPADAERLRQRLDDSAAGTAPLLVMVDGPSQRLLGTAGLFTRVGNAAAAEPFYAYRLERSVHRSDSLNVHHELDTLHLVKTFHGPTEIGTLFLHPDHRGGGNGRTLSLSRFLLMARQPQQFDHQVIAELRGVIDDYGRSPFWDGLGRHFFRVDYPVADQLSARDKRFIAELMPTHPVYVCLLPPEARQVIGQVHPRTAPARRLLEDEGFHPAGMVDIFDAGPCLRCDRDAIRSIRDARRQPVVALTEPDPAAAADHLIAPAAGDFRAAAAAVSVTPEGVRLPRDLAGALQLQVGDTLHHTPLRAAAPAAAHAAATPAPEPAP
jgi:arginine N-succinyltransferase